MPRNNNERINSSPEVVHTPNLTAAPQNLLDFVIPTDHVTLPSQGKFYSPTHPLYECESVEIKYISTKELDILTSDNLLKKGIAIDRMIQCLLVNPEIKVEDLFIGDKNAIIIAARVGAFGGTYPVEFKCTHCGSQINHEFNLVDLEHKESSSSEINFSDKGTFFITLPQTKVMTECRLLTTQDDKSLTELATRNKKVGLPPPSLSDQYKLFIVSFNGVTERGLVDEFVNVMPVSDLHYLAKEYEKIRPDLDLSDILKCDMCSSDNNVTLPFTANFFWP